MANYGMKVTVKGKGITSTDPADYLMWTKYPNAKIVPITSPTTVTVVAGDYNATYTVTHNLGYYPIYELYFEGVDGNVVKIPGKSGDTHTTRAILDSETTNAITIRIGKQSGTYGSNVTYNIGHKVYYDPRPA